MKIIFPMLIFSVGSAVSLNEQEHRESILHQIKEACKEEQQYINLLAKQLMKENSWTRHRAKAEVTEASMCYWLPKIKIAMTGSTVAAQTGKLGKLEALCPQIQSLFQFASLTDAPEFCLMSTGEDVEKVKLVGSFQDGFDAGKTLGKHEVPTLDMYLYSIKQGVDLMTSGDFSVIPKEAVKEVIDNLPLDNKQKTTLLANLNAVETIVVSKSESGDLTAISKDDFSEKLTHFINAIKITDSNRRVGPEGSVYVKIPIGYPLKQLLESPRNQVKDAELVHHISKIPPDR